MHKIYQLGFAIACLALPAQLFAQSPLSSKANLTDVTVYNGSAELNHQARVRLPVGTSEVVFTQVANNIDPNSIQIGSSTSVVVLSARANRTASAEETKSVAYTTQEGIYKTEFAKLTKLKDEVEAEGSVLNLLIANQKISNEGGSTTMDAISKMANFHRTKYLASKETIAKLTEQIEKQQIKVDREKEILDEMEGQNTAGAGQLIVQVMSSQAGEQPFNISYATPSASWGASYDLRAADVSSPLDIIYKANVTQQTGIDWHNVNLTLATGNPSQFGSIAELTPWSLYFQQPKAPAAKLHRGALSADVAYLEEVVVSGYNSSSYTTMDENQLNSTFKIDIPYNIASNGVSHAVTLQEYRHPATYTYQAVPKSDEQVYLVAELIDYEKLNLLPGSANIVFDNMLVGKTYVNPQISSDTLKLSMGRDKMIAVKREKVNDLSQTKTFGSSKRQTLVYEITVKNNKKSAVHLQLKDQYPLSTDKSMEINLEESSGATIDTTTGLMTWGVDLKAGETKKIRFSYSIKYPKDKTIQLY